MTPADDMPLMRLDDLAALERALAAAPHSPSGSSSRTRRRFTRAWPRPASARTPTTSSGLLPPAGDGREGLRAYVGEVDGEVVTTALGVTVGDWRRHLQRRHAGRRTGARLRRGDHRPRGRGRPRRRSELGVAPVEPVGLRRVRGARLQHARALALLGARLAEVLRGELVDRALGAHGGRARAARRAPSGRAPPPV